MSDNRSDNTRSRAGSRMGGVFLLLLAAGAGYILLTLPGSVIETYDRAAARGPAWAYGYLACMVLGGLLIAAVAARVAYGIWRNTRRRRERKVRDVRSPAQLSAAERQAAFTEALGEARQAVAELQADDAQSSPAAVIDQRVRAAERKIETQRLEIVAFGTISSGKSALLNTLAGREVFETCVSGGTTTRRAETPWPGADRVVLVDTPGLGEVHGGEHEAMAREAAADADLVLLVLDGPLRESEAALVRILERMDKRLVVCLNKADWYERQDAQALRNQVIEQLREHLKGSPSTRLDERDVVLVQARASARQRVRRDAQGRERVETVDVEPDIDALARRLVAVVKHDGRDLLLMNLLMQSQALAAEAKRHLGSVLDERADQIIRRYMWRSGAVAAAVPFASVDIAAGLSISTKMVLELARIYRQPVDLDTARTLLKELGRNLATILGSHAVGPALASLAGSALKTVPGVGTITGGLVQGLAQALVTRWIGRVFVVYFKQQMHAPAGGLAGVARRQWDEMLRDEGLGKLAREAAQHLSASDDRRDRPA